MSGQRTRIDPRLELIQPEQVRAYLAAHGWHQQPYPRPEVWVFTKPKTFDVGHLTLTAPSSASLVDYLAGVEDLIRALTVWEDSYFTDILSEMLRYPVPTAETTNGAKQDKGSTPLKPTITP